MKRIIGILTLSCLLFSACGKDEIPQEENEKKTEETTPGDDTGGDESDDDPDSPKLVVPLHVEGRYLKNEQGKIVNLHGFTQTYSPYFNNNAWSNYDVSSCLSYNKSMVDKILAAGWKFNFVRLHMDPYWSSKQSQMAASTGRRLLLRHSLKPLNEVVVLYMYRPAHIIRVPLNF